MAEIVVTPEMAAAGACELVTYDWEFEQTGEAAERVYRAMRQLEPVNLGVYCASCDAVYRQSEPCGHLRIVVERSIGR